MLSSSAAASRTCSAARRLALSHWAEPSLCKGMEDEGPGVPEHMRSEIFERFHSLRPEGEAFGKHSGLGLAIARTIISGHAGSLAVRDRADAQQGAVFVATLPAGSQ